MDVALPESNDQNDGLLRTAEFKLGFGPMSSEIRKAESERKLRAMAVTVYEGLPLIEDESESQVRTVDELVRRLVALWAVTGTAFLRENAHFREYVKHNGLESWLSDRERAFVMGGPPTEHDCVQFSWKVEALYFLAWCGGLIQSISPPRSESSVDTVLPLFPRKLEPPSVLREAIVIRSKSEILDWSDLLYRLHWAVRDASINGQTALPDIVGGAVQEWHQAVNWMTCYEDEDDWDHVGTDT